MPAISATEQCPWCNEFITTHQDGRGNFVPCEDWVGWDAYYSEQGYERYRVLSWRVND